MPLFVLGLVIGFLTAWVASAWQWWRRRRIPAVTPELQQDMRRLAGIDTLELDWSGPTPPPRVGAAEVKRGGRNGPALPDRREVDLHSTGASWSRRQPHADHLPYYASPRSEAESTPQPASPPLAAQPPATPPRRHDDTSTSVAPEYPRGFWGLDLSGLEGCVLRRGGSGG